MLPSLFYSFIMSRIISLFNTVLNMVAGPQERLNKYCCMNEWIHRVFIIINIIIVIIIEDLYWSDLTKFLFYKNTHFILLNVKIKMSPWVRLYETMTLEYLVEHLQQCLGNCIKPKLCRLAQGWAATSWDVSIRVWQRGSHSRSGGFSGSLTVP